jgi:probable F420-dependent oxidoreductase
MSSVKPFRFGAGAFMAASQIEWAENARRIETLGYDTLLIADHFEPDLFAPIPALMAAALATTRLRVGAYVFDNDFRHPALLAKETATVDVLSNGRLDVGMGAGWYKEEYDQVGIPFDPPGMRVGRLQEAVHILKGLWGDGPFTFTGQHYTIQALDNWPKPVQRPHPPLCIGAGGKRLLCYAAQEADIIGIIAPALPAGGIDIESDSEARLAKQVGWVREAAGERFDHLELAALVWGVSVTDDPRSAAEKMAQASGLTPEQILTSPYYLLGSIDGIVERLVSLREQYGVSYYSVFPSDVEAFAPVAARLAGS